MQIDWSEYSRVHAHRTNLVIHLFSVPLFVGSFISLLLYLANGDWVSGVIVVALCFVALALQALGHRLEHEDPRPFSSFLNFLRRWFTEQFLIFPVFLLSGRWWNQISASTNGGADES